MNKKGFTLIELLAVILILGIIALIAIPTVNNLVKSAQKSAFERTGEAIVKSAEEECALNTLKSMDYDVAHSFYDGQTQNMNLKGKMPTSGGVVTMNDKCDVAMNISNDKFCAMKSANSEGIVTGEIVNGICVIDEVKRPSCTNQDANPGSFNGEGTSSNPYLIESIEDLYAIKSMTSTQTKDKYFKLAVDLDFKDDCSYNNPSNTTYNDLNKDGTTKGMKEEATTGYGFIYPGTEINAFAGNFDGNGKIIRNLYISGNGENDYAGLFEKVENTTSAIYVKNITLENVNITNMNSKVGGLIAVIGENTIINVSNISVSGSINSVSDAGGIIGVSSSVSGSTFDNLIFNGKVKCTDGYCGGILGIQNSIVASGETPISMTNIKSVAEVTAESHAGVVMGQGHGMELNTIYAYGKISNVGLTKSWQGWMAGIAGKITVDKSYEIQNIYNYAYVELARVIGLSGGLFGQIGNITSGTIDSSDRAILKKAYNYGNINLISTYGNVSGIAGEIVSLNLYDCYNYGDVDSKDMTYGSVINGIFCSSCIITNSGNYGDISGYYNVNGINGTEIYNSVNHSEINCGDQCRAFRGDAIKNSYSFGKVNFKNLGATFLSNNVENSYAKEELDAAGPDDLDYGFSANGFGPNKSSNSAFVGSLTKNDAKDKSLTDSTWTNSLDFMTGSSAYNTQTYDNVYGCKIGGNTSSTKGIQVEFNAVTTSWFKDTVKLGNSFLYEEGYYPRVYKLDMSGNVTNELVEGQTRISIR